MMSKESSEFYRLGYKMGYLSLTTFLKKIMPPNEFDSYRDRIKEHYDSYPCMELLNLDQLKEQ